MSERVTIGINEYVATVTLNRADKRNAVDFEMFESLAGAAESLGSDSSVRAVVLHGAGDHFCAGIDISVFAGDGIGASTADLMQPRSESGANFFQSAALCWRELPVPVIAALQGSVFGAGLQIAMGADLRYASPDARLSIMEIKWGLIPDMGISATLPGIVPQDKVRELSYTGRVVEAEEAQALNLVTEVCADPLAKATAIANEIAGRSPDAIRAIKELINTAWRDDPAETLRTEARLQMAVMSGDNQKEAVRANIDKRAPAFRDPS